MQPNNAVTDEYSQSFSDYDGTVPSAGWKVKKRGVQSAEKRYEQLRRWRAKHRSSYNEYQRRYMRERGLRMRLAEVSLSTY